MNYRDLPMPILLKMQSVHLQPQQIVVSSSGTIDSSNNAGTLQGLLQNSDHNANESKAFEMVHQQNTNANSDRAWRRMQMNTESDQLKRNRGKRQAQYDKIRDKKNVMNLLDERDEYASDDSLNVPANVSEIQRTKEIIVDQHKAINEYLLHSIQLFHMAKNEDYDQNAYIKQGEEIFTQLAVLATNCRNLMTDLRSKAMNNTE